MLKRNSKRHDQLIIITMMTYLAFILLSFLGCIHFGYDANIIYIEYKPYRFLVLILYIVCNILEIWENNNNVQKIKMKWTPVHIFCRLLGFYLGVGQFFLTMYV